MQAATNIITILTQLYTKNIPASQEGDPVQNALLELAY